MSDIDSYITARRAELEHPEDCSLNSVLLEFEVALCKLEDISAKNKELEAALNKIGKVLKIKDYCFEALTKSLNKAEAKNKELVAAIETALEMMDDEPVVTVLYNAIKENSDGGI